MKNTVANQYADDMKTIANLMMIVPSLDDKAKDFLFAYGQGMAAVADLYRGENQAQGG